MADGRLMPSTPLISISVVSHGDGGPLRTLLESLARNEPPERLQLLITDNLGRDLPEMVQEGWQSVVMLRPDRPRGFAANHNAAFERATGHYFCVLNPDVVFVAPVLLRLIERLRRGEGDIVAPLIADSRGMIQDSFRPLPSPLEIAWRRLGYMQLPAVPVAGSLLRPDWIAGIFMLMQHETFARLGGFDPRYRMYFEDVDLCTRARLMGLRILVDTALRLQHDPRHASRRAGKYLLWHIQSGMRFFASEGYRRARRMRQNA